MKVHLELSLLTPMPETGMLFRKTVGTDRLYIQEDDQYEYVPGESAPIIDVMWMNDFESVRAKLAITIEHPDVFHKTARALLVNDWIESTGITLPKAKSWTWSTVPIGYLVQGRGYIVYRSPSSSPLNKVVVTFHPEEGSLITDRYVLMLDADEEVNSGNGQTGEGVRKDQ